MAGKVKNFARWWLAEFRAGWERGNKRARLAKAKYEAMKYDLYDNPDPATLHSLSGDWTEITPGVRVRLWNAPNEEDMQEHYNPNGIVILQVEVK